MVAETLKQALARRQLGTALALFLADSDPVSVHCLACGGGELASHLAAEAHETPFNQHALSLYSDMKPKELFGLRNKYWNAMKHATDLNGILRDDDVLMSGFTDEHNDHALFVGWYDYANAVKCIPIEAQAFQVWYFVNFPEKLADEFPAADYERFFPGIRTMSRVEKKRALKRKIDWAKTRIDAMMDSRTDRRRLILGRLSVPLPIA